MANKGTGQGRAKKAGARKAARKTTGGRKAARSRPVSLEAGKHPLTGGHGMPTAAEWGRIYAKAWLDDAFRQKLEKDPTEAMREFAKEYGMRWDKLVTLKFDKPPKRMTTKKLRAVLEGAEIWEASVIACC